MATIRPIGSDAGKSLLRRIAIFVVLVIVIIVGFSSCVTRVDAGHVGIRVRLAGSARGVDDIPQVTGWVFFNPLTEQIILFPTSVQNIVWTRDPHEGSPRDDSITFSSQEGVNINADIGLAFHIEPSMAPHLYLRFRKNDLIELAGTYVRNAVRESFNLQASQMPVQAIYGADKGKLVAAVHKRIQDELGKDGFVIDQLTINGALRLPENVAQAINRAMEATQLAIQAENRVRQVKAEAEQAVTQARGQADAVRERARGDAEARLITSKAEAKANLILRASTSPTVLQYRALERWNGKLPVMNGGGAMPLLTFDVSKVAPLSAEEERVLKELLAEDDKEKEKEKGTADAPKQDAPKDAPKPDAPKTP